MLDEFLQVADLTPADLDRDLVGTTKGSPGGASCAVVPVRRSRRAAGGGRDMNAVTAQERRRSRLRAPQRGVGDVTLCRVRGRANRVGS
jgi:hypothetical protein